MGSTYSSLIMHATFSTEGRRMCIRPGWMEDLHGVMGGQLKSLGATPLRIGGIEDHVHIIMGLRATHVVADILREVKKSSGSWVRHNHDPSFAWQSGYAVFTLHHSDVPRMTSYVDNQAVHHHRVSSRQELVDLCVEAGIDPDPKFFE